MKKNIILFLVCILFWLMFLSQDSNALLWELLFKASKSANKFAKTAEVLKVIEKVPLKKGALFNREMKLIKLLPKSPLHDKIVQKYGKKIIFLFFKTNKGIADDLIKEFGDDIVIKKLTREEAIQLLAYRKVYSDFGINELQKSKSLKKIIFSKIPNLTELKFLFKAKFKKFKGKIVAQRDDIFDPCFKDKLGRTNIERMKIGLAPQGKDGKPIELHHLKQKNWVVMELTYEEHHKKYYNRLHGYEINSQIDRVEWRIWKNSYWRHRAQELILKGIVKCLQH